MISNTGRQAIDLIPDSDWHVWQNVQNQASTFGLGSKYTKEALDLASTPQVKSAMKIALDSHVWQNVQNQASTFGLGSKYTKEALDLASDKRARTIFERLLRESAREEAGSKFNFSDFGGSDRFGFQTGDPYARRKRHSARTAGGDGFGFSAGHHKRTRGPEGDKANQQTGQGNARAGNGSRRDDHTGRSRQDTHNQRRHGNNTTPPHNKQEQPQRPPYEAEIDQRIFELREAGKTGKQILRLLAKQYHPDVEGGSTEAMKYVNSKTWLQDIK